MKAIPVIDLFAGPGGLGEGFAAMNETGLPDFKIALSIEKEANAHMTLELRCFFRQFSKSEVPCEYYQYLNNEISKDDLFSAYPKQSDKAKSQARQATLGLTDNDQVDDWISEALGGYNYEWILIGGPPCQAYSLAGRSRNKGIRDYKPELDIRHTLYKEYLRTIAKFWPSVFIMENVKGILSSKVDGQSVFEQIYRDLQDPGKALDSHSRYRYKIYSLVEPRSSRLGVDNNFTIKSEDYGIPQARHRVILMGVRDTPEFENIVPTVLEPELTKTSVWDVISDLPKIRSGISVRTQYKKSWGETLEEILNHRWFSSLSIEMKNKLTHRLSEAVINDKLIPELSTTMHGKEKMMDAKLSRWYTDENLKGVCNHATRSQMPSDLHRYFFASCFAEVNGKSITLNDLPLELRPNHKNTEEAIRTNNLFSDRFRVQLPDKPATTITSHIAKDGHYYIHPDPAQCRSLSVREAARLQTFPDNYFFCGSRTAQYIQVGNAVPPLLAIKIAKIVSVLINKSRSNNGI